MILLTLCYIHTHTYIQIHTHVTTIGTLLSLQPMTPLGCSEGLDVFGFFLLKTTSTVQHKYSYSVSQWYKMQQQCLRSHRNELHNSPVHKHVILLQQGQFVLRTSSTV